MTYNLRDRNLLSTKGSYVESRSLDDSEDEDENLDADPDYARHRTPRRPRSNQTNATQRNNNVGIRISDSRGASSSGNAETTAERRLPGKRSAEERTHRGQDRQAIIAERRRRKKRLNPSQLSEEEMSKRTVLSWLISSCVVQENEKVWYVDNIDRLGAEGREQQVLVTGKINREGILCSCCSRMITVKEFEIHAVKRETKTPYKHIVLADWSPSHTLLQCQIEAWEDSDEEEKRAYKYILPEEKGTDGSDDACMICADGGDLMCCERCPSTYHPKCLYMESIPQGVWHCPYCLCKFCGEWDGALKKCTQCEKLYHSKCGGEALDMNSTASLFCEDSCKRIYEGLQSMVGVRNDLKDGLNWSLHQRADHPLDPNSDSDYSRIVGNSKIAVAWEVINESFLSSIDRHTRINIPQSIVYNRGSNIMRINYGAFYTAVLEKNEEVICAASLRVHGKRIAEMPYIATREEHRGRGMARILENCIESALSALQVQKLVIPAVDEVAGMWVQRYNFTHMDEQSNQELSHYNMVMFPSSVVRLQKNLAKLPDLNLGPSGTN